MSNQQLAEELHKPVIRKLEKWKLCSSFKDNVWGADSVDKWLKSEFKGFCCVLLIFIVNMVGLFFWKIKRVLKLLMFLKKL